MFLFVSLCPPPQSSGGQSNQRGWEGSLSRPPTAGKTVSTPSLPPSTAGLAVFKSTKVQYIAYRIHSQTSIHTDPQTQTYTHPNIWLTPAHFPFFFKQTCTRHVQFALILGISYAFPRSVSSGCVFPSSHTEAPVNRIEVSVHRAALLTHTHTPACLWLCAAEMTGWQACRRTCFHFSAEHGVYDGREIKLEDTKTFLMMSYWINGVWMTDQSKPNVRNINTDVDV